MRSLSSTFQVSDLPALYIIAEAGVNHDGDVTDAHALIDVAADSGADAVKFQTFDPKAMVSEIAAAAPYQVSQSDVSTQIELLNNYVLPREAWKELVFHARERQVEFMSTAFDLSSLDLVCDLGVGALKLGSGELTNKPLLLEVAGRGLPVICSTGMGSHGEVASAVHWLSAAPGLMLMHCVSAYPAPPEQANLRAIVSMRKAFCLPVGWSDHTVGNVTSIAAVALGAAALEKHITLDMSRPGPDHAASADPEAFAAYVADTRAASSALGSGEKSIAPAEIENVELVRRSWHTTRDLRAGDVLGAADVVALRPASGIAPADDVVGRVATRAVPRGHSLSIDDLTADAP